MMKIKDPAVVTTNHQGGEGVVTAPTIWRPALQAGLITAGPTNVRFSNPMRHIQPNTRTLTKHRGLNRAGSCSGRG
jgi:hypothetical protein